MYTTDPSYFNIEVEIRFGEDTRTTVFHQEHPRYRPEMKPEKTLLYLNYNTLLYAGISVCANQKLKTNFGPVIRSLGVSPLKKLVKPSFLTILPTILNPLSGLSKLRFCILVLMTSSGAETIRDADAPATDATPFCTHVAVL